MTGTSRRTPRPVARQIRRRKEISEFPPGTVANMSEAFDWLRSELTRLGKQRPDAAAARIRTITEYLRGEAGELSRAEVERAKNGRHGPARSSW